MSDQHAKKPEIQVTESIVIGRPEVKPTGTVAAANKAEEFGENELGQLLEAVQFAMFLSDIPDEKARMDVWTRKEGTKTLYEPTILDYSGVSVVVKGQAEPVAEWILAVRAVVYDLINRK